MRALARTALRPDLPPLVPRRVGGPREDPDRRRRAARGQPRRRHPVRRAGDHARHRDRARPARLRPGRPLVQGRCRSSARSGRAPAACVAHPDNAYRLLREQQQLVLVFPEGSKGPGKTYSERYRLRRFGRGGFVEIAMRAGVPDRAHRGRRRRGVDADPVQDRRRSPRRSASRTSRSPPTCWRSARSARVALLPGQVQAAGARPGALRRRRPTRSATRAAGSWTSPRRIRAADPGGAVRHAARSAARSGSAERPMGRRVLITGLGTFWGGRVAQALERGPRRRRHRRARPRRAARSSSSAPSTSAATRTTRSSPASCRPPRSTRSCTRSSSSTRRRWRPRTMHEINVIGTMNLFAAASAAGQHGAQRRGEVVDARLRRSPRGPDVVPRGDAGARRRRAPASSAACSRSRATCATSPRTTRTSASRCCGSRTCSAPTSSRRSSKALELPLVPSVFGFDPRFQFVHEDDVVPLDPVRARATRCPGVYNVAGDGLLPWSEVARICGKRTVPMPPFGIGLAAAPLRRLGCRPARRAARPAQLRPRRRQPAAQAGRLQLPVHVGRHGAGVRRGAAPAPDRRRHHAGLPVRARRRALLPPLPRRRARPVTKRVRADCSP